MVFFDRYYEIICKNLHCFTIFFLMLRSYQQETRPFSIFNKSKVMGSSPAVASVFRKEVETGSGLWMNLFKPLSRGRCSNKETERNRVAAFFVFHWMMYASSSTYYYVLVEAAKRRKYKLDKDKVRMRRCGLIIVGKETKYCVFFYYKEFILLNLIKL